MATTLRDIAARVGTSEATVSLVLNGRQYHRVSQAMRERIEEVARELNYRPNRQAQLLAGGKTKTVALLVNRLLNQFFAEYLSVMESRLSDEGYHAVPFETLSQADRAEDLLGMIDQRLCDAIIALEYTGDPEKSRKRGADFPLTLRVEEFGHKADPSGKANTVFVDYAPATRRLFETFREAGATRIGLLTDTRHDVNLPPLQRSARAESQLAMITELGLFRDPTQCVSLSQESDLSEWALAAETLLTREPGIDCLLIHNATVTPAVLHQLEMMGRKVGRDIAVATYDDPISAKWLGGGLTVVREPIEDVAASLVRTTLDRIEERRTEQGDGTAEVRHEAELVTRASSNLSR
jgi:DNA-binding LacI/PurR family transcriptional regulator